MKNIAVGIGEVLWDIFPDGKKMGGAPTNFVWHVSQFGASGCLVSAVGEDELGREIRESLALKGVSGLVENVPFPTGTVEVELDGEGIPRYDITENVAWDNIPYSPELEALASEARAVCFGSLAQRSVVSRATIDRFLDAMPHGDDRLVVFDVNLRQGFYDKEIVTGSLDRCNILKINDEELITVSRMLGFPGLDLEGLCRRLLEEYNLKVVILTCGVNGSYVFTADEVSFLPTPEVEVADTVGAGDSFTAAFIASLMKGKSIKDAHATAVRASAFVCTQNGATPILPDEIVNG